MNIVLIAIDTLRADHLDCCGYWRETSPTLSRLAEEGVLFENFFAAAIPTDPSFASAFSGVPDYAHRIAGVIPDRSPPEGTPWLPSLLAEAGWHTCAADNLQGHAEFFGEGYADYGWPGMGREDGKREKRNAELITAAGLELLDGLPEEPFFMFLHYWDPHTPYLPPDRWDGMFYDGDPTAPCHDSMAACRAFPGPGTGWIDEEVTDSSYVTAQYDAEIAYNSEHLGAFLEELGARGLYEDSLIVAFSDHGEVLDGHVGCFDHHGLYDANIQVPLIVKLPRGERAGERLETMAQMVDLPVTLLRQAGLEVPEAMEGRDLLAPDAAQNAPEELFLGEGTWQVKRGVRTREWKFIRAASDSYLHNWHGQPLRELYNLKKDPAEQANLANVEPRVAAELERRLDRWLGEMRERCGWDDPLVEFGPTLLKKRGELGPTPAEQIE